MNSAVNIQLIIIGIIKYERVEHSKIGSCQKCTIKNKNSKIGEIMQS